MVSVSFTADFAREEKGGKDTRLGNDVIWERRK